jgi:hypothetical protein
MQTPVLPETPHDLPAEGHAGPHQHASGGGVRRSAAAGHGVAQRHIQRVALADVLADAVHQLDDGPHDEGHEHVNERAPEQVHMGPAVDGMTHVHEGGEVNHHAMVSVRMQQLLP